MDAIDPKGVRPFFVPVTEEIASEQKKLRKAGGMDEPTDISSNRDTSQISQTAQNWMSNQKDAKLEAFLEEAKAELMQMDWDSETFLPDATQKMVSSALEKEYGKKFTGKPGYAQIEATLTKQILKNPEWREVIEGFLGTLSESESQGQPESQES